jgi:hypothetical protein
MMNAEAGKHRIWAGGLAVLVMVLFGNPGLAPGYLTKTAGGNTVTWRSGSAATIWNDATKTLTWHYNPINFPQPNWPSTKAEIGAAFQHGYQTLQDVSGTSINFSRGPDTSGTPVTGDGKAEMVLAPTETADYFGQDISGAFAVTYWLWDANGVMQDADIEVNGDPKSFTWATSGPPPPAGTNDLQLTICHEQFHSIGGGHPVYFYAMVWPVGRSPEDMMHDRCLSPDDRNLMRTLYPAGTPFSTISGTVTLAAGGACDRAVVVATDAAGIPQATVVTGASGAYSINVPPGSGYSVTAHHSLNSTYNSDIDFTGCTGFISSGSVSAVNATANVSGVDFTVTGGTPDLTLTQLGMNGGALGTQTVFLPKNSSGTIQLEITSLSGKQLSTVNSMNLGPGITIGTVTVTPGAAGITDLSFPFTVAAGASAGVRNLSFVTTVNGNEALLLPSYVEVLDTGTLAVGASAGNPPAAGVATGAANVPLLGVSFTAGASEDVRIRQLQFDVAGSGQPLPAVRLWIDNGTLGSVDGADIRLYSGNAYVNSPVSETMTVTPPGTILFDNLVLTVPAGQTVKLLVSADMPASGTGAYTVSFNPAGAGNIVSQGMFWGDVITPSGGTVTGGTASIGGLAIGSLAQIRTTAQTVIPVGGATNELQVTLKGTPTDASSQVGMDVEVKPLGQAFTNVPSGSAAATNPSGTMLSVTVAGLTNFTSYHWQARPVSSSTGPGAWVSFGGNSESAPDFSVDTSTTNPPSALAQFASDGVTSVPLGGTATDSVVLQATNGTNSAAGQVRLEFEVVPSGAAFTNVPNLFSAFGPSGAAGAASFSGPAGDYHWQVRSSDAFGAASGWVPFNAAAIHFHLDVSAAIKASTGCIATTAAGAGRCSWVTLATLVLLAGALLGLRSPKRTVMPLLFLLSIASAVQAADDETLPRALGEFGFAGAAPNKANREPDAGFPGLPSEPAAAPSRSWIDFEAYVGFLFLDLAFDATGTDMIERKAKGDGAGVVGLEAMIALHPDWSVGLDIEGDFWSDLRILAAGPAVRWRFAASHTSYETGRPDVEHFARVAVFYEKLAITKQDFGSFDPTFGVRAGYEARISVGRSWAVALGLEFQYSKWKYSPTVVTGDTSIGGFGGMLSIGLAFEP